MFIGLVGLRNPFFRSPRRERLATNSRDRSIGSRIVCREWSSFTCPLECLSAGGLTQLAAAPEKLWSLRGRRCREAVFELHQALSCQADARLLDTFGCVSLEERQKKQQVQINSNLIVVSRSPAPSLTLSD